jgi:hypothetical protein
MNYLLTDTGRLLCPAHAARWRKAHPSLTLQPDEYGWLCDDCDLYGPPLVASIRVAGVAHCVQDDEGNLVDEIVATEQCDSCGSTRDDGSQAPLVLGASGGSACYICDRCGAEHRIRRTSDEETVF